MPGLFSPISIKGLTVRNRIVFPPVVCFHYALDDGLVTDRNVEHYRKRAAGGAGIVITEATAVWKDGRLAAFQLGLWSDEHIPGLSRIAKVVEENGALPMIQIHHAGWITPETVSAEAAGPSTDEKNPRSRSMTLDEIRTVRDAFIEGAIRAKRAGFRGVELHGAHGYLLNQFASSFMNRREDEYGGTFDGRMRLATEIIAGIRKECGEDFIIGYRLGANSPTLEDGIAVAKHLESLGIDLIHVSHGGSLQNLPRPPKDFEFNWIVYCSTIIKKEVSIPVIAVNEIKTPERAEKLIDDYGLDFIALARPQLADPAWADHVKNKDEINFCLSCKPRCRWYEDSELCPAVIRLRKAED